MSIGTVIFIGFVVVTLISKAVKAAKKENPEPKPLVGRPLQEAVLVQQSKQQPANAAQRRSKSKSVPALAPQSLFEEGARQIKETPPMEIQMPDSEMGGVYDFFDREEIRKGIVFSEVFNRKY